MLWSFHRGTLQKNLLGDSAVTKNLYTFYNIPISTASKRLLFDIQFCRRSSPVVTKFLHYIK